MAWEPALQDHAYLLYDLGMAYKTEKNLAKAKGFFEQSLAYQAAHNISANVRPLSLNALADIASEQGYFARQGELLSTILAEEEKFSDLTTARPLFFLQSRLGLGASLRKQGQYDTALGEVEAVLAAFGPLDQVSTLPARLQSANANASASWALLKDALVHQAEILAHMGWGDDARSALDRALAGFRKGRGKQDALTLDLEKKRQAL